MRVRLCAPGLRLCGRHYHALVVRTKDADEVAEHASPYQGGDGDVGVLLCHGFTGSPWSMRPWADRLEAAGCRVSLPLLPGHGTNWRDLNGRTWPEWYSTVEDAFLELKSQTSQVFVAGLSMGGALALRLAQHQDVAGLIVVNPLVKLSDIRLVALPVLKRVLGQIPSTVDDIAKPGVSEYGYFQRPLMAVGSMLEMCADVRSGLPNVKAPLLLFRSTQDHVVDAGSGRILMAEVGSPERTEVLLHRSYHVATLDYDADEIFDSSISFIRNHSGS